jgi:hypothetical protein
LILWLGERAFRAAKFIHRNGLLFFALPPERTKGSVVYDGLAQQEDEVEGRGEFGLRSATSGPIGSANTRWHIPNVSNEKGLWDQPREWDIRRLSPC